MKTIQTVFAIFFVFFWMLDVEARCSSNNCAKYSCVSDFYVHRPLDNYLRAGLTFNSPCSCANDWNSMFCNQTLTALSLNDQNALPTVCICRKFSDDGTKCQQFMTRCFSRRNNECSCCFNQPNEWCNQLNCKNREPDFSNANTTCVCYHNPLDYPFEVCTGLRPRDSGLFNIQEIQNNNWEASKISNDTIEIFGRRIPTVTLTYCIVGLLLTVSILTLLMLIVGGRKLRMKRSERRRQTRLARETLILQRADDDRYLPSA